MNIKKLCAVFTFLMLFIFAGCGSEEAETEIIPTQPEVLTHVYIGENVSLPDGYTFLSSVRPIFRDGIFTVLCRLDDMSYRTVSFDTDGNITGEEPVSVDLENMTLHGGIISENDIVLYAGYFSSAEKIRTAHLIRTSLADGQVTESLDIIPLFSSPEAKERFYKILGFERDGSGCYYFFSETEMIVLDKDFTHILTYPSSGFIEGYAVNPEGKLTVYGSFAKGMGQYSPNPETKIPDMFTETDENLAGHYYDPAGNMYFKANDGLYIIEKTGSTLQTDETLLMHWQNSGLTSDRILICSVAERDTFLGMVSNYGASGGKLQIFRKSEDIVISEIESIDIADLGGVDEYIRALVVDYNLLHRDRRIVITDFGEMENGESHLMTAIQTGTYRPDIIIGSPESTVMRKIVEDELYADLLPYLEADDYLNTDNIFGAVKRIFDDSGKMWGISPKFTVKTVTAPVAKVGERTYWSLEELLDYAENLPEEEDLMYPVLRKNAADMILGPAGYSMFVDFDENTASFDSDLFVRYLEFIASLPADYDYYSDKYGGYRKDALHSGKVTLDNTIDINAPINWLRFEMNFDTKDYTVIGYPSDSEASSYATCESAYVITSFADDPDAMWDILKALYPLDVSNAYYQIQNGLPSLKSIYDDLAEEESNIEYFMKYAGGITGHSYDPANPTKPEDLKEPAIITYFDSETAAEMREFLDTRVGTSVMDMLPAGLEEVITEEISAYIAGRYTAEECADIIQSRAEIWLAEHE